MFFTCCRRCSNSKNEKASNKMSFPMEVFHSKKSETKYSPSEVKLPSNHIFTVSSYNGDEETILRNDIFRSVSSGSIRSIQSFYSTRSSMRSTGDDDFYSVCSDSSSAKN